MEKTLDGWGGNETGTTGSWDKLGKSQSRCKELENYKTYSDGNGTALSALLGWQRVRKTQVCTPVTSSDWQNAQLGDDDGGTDGSCDFLGGLDTKTNMSLGITNDNDGLESGTLTGTSLLLDGLDLCVIYSSVNCDSTPQSAHFTHIPKDRIPS